MFLECIYWRLHLVILMKPFIAFLSYCTWLYRFMTRPDVKQKRLGDFLDWSLTTISQTNDQSMRDIMVLDGALQSLVNTHTPRSHSKPVVLWAHLSVDV